MTTTLDRTTLVDLAKHDQWPAISIYMGAGRESTTSGAAVIRLKNLLKQAEAALRDEGLRATAIEELLRPAIALTQDASFWRQGTAAGLALHLSSESSSIHHLDVAPPETMMIGDRFLIRPMLPAVDRGERFIVLALSKNRVRLLEGGRSRIDEVDVAGMPAGLADALKYDDYERQVQFHSGTPAAGGGGRRAAIFHGHGGASDVKKDNLSRYFRLVDRQLKDFLHADTPPLLLAGVDYLLPIYRSVSAYPNLVDGALAGNPDNASAAALHTEALALLEPYFRAELERDLSDLGNLLGTGVASEDLGVIVPAAHQGRVKTLFVAPESTAYGVFDRQSASVMVGEGLNGRAQDLMNLAAVETLNHGGIIHAIEPSETLSAAAIFRY